MHKHLILEKLKEESAQVYIDWRKNDNYDSEMKFQVLSFVIKSLEKRDIYYVVSTLTQSIHMDVELSRFEFIQYSAYALMILSKLIAK
jgi:ubiquinone biosynthesis protein Coq4